MSTEALAIGGILLALACGALPFVLSYYLIDENRGGWL